MRSPILKRDRIRLGLEPRLADEAPRAGTAVSPLPGDESPTVNYRRRGDVVEAIEITCPCGHAMVLECEYETFGDDDPET